MSILNDLSIYELLGVLILSLVPTIIFVSLILISDQKSREPIELIIICLLSGFFTISFSLLIGKIILPSLDAFRDRIFDLKSFSIIRIIILALIEEYSKLVVLYFFMSHNKKFDDIYDGFVYSSLIALSFAGMETLLYIFNETSYQDMTSLAVMRNVSTIPLHLVCGIAMGYYVALDRFSNVKKYKIINLIKCILMPVFIHSVYNSFFSITMINLRTKPYALLIILIFLISIYFIGILYLRRIIELNNIFIDDKEYPDEYKNLMTQSEFIKERNIKEGKDSSLEEIIYNDNDFTPFKN